MKTLLRIDNVQGSICSTETSCESETDYLHLFSSIVTLMCKDQRFAQTIIDAASQFVCRNREIREVARMGIRAAESKTNN